jgi:hypothetical protein
MFVPGGFRSARTQYGTCIEGSDVCQTLRRIRRRNFFLPRDAARKVQIGGPIGVKNLATFEPEVRGALLFINLKTIFDPSLTPLRNV